MTTSPRTNGFSKVKHLNGTKAHSAASYFADVAGVSTRLPYAMIDRVTEVLYKAYLERRTVLLFGNGGSAALASHLACDLAKGTVTTGADRFRVMALTDNIALITAWANDSSYDDIFVEQLRNFLQPRDIALAISGSGNSPNVLKALELARTVGAYTIGFGGYQGGKMKPLCDLCIVVPSENMQIIEDLHLSIAHCVFRAVRAQITQASALAARV